MDEAVRSVPGDGIVRENFGKDVVLDLSDPDKERAAVLFPVRLLFGGAATGTWMFACEDKAQATQFWADVVQPASTYNIPAIELDRFTSKSAVATVFEKVNTGGLPLNVFELLTAVFAGDAAYFAEHGTDFRLNDDWVRTKERFATQPVLSGVENTDFLQAVCLLATLKRATAHEGSGKPPAVSARREDVLTLRLDDYLEWVEPLRRAFLWAATFLADHHIFDAKFLPYPKQLVPLAVVRVLLGKDADLHGVRTRLGEWFWCGVLGELYGGSIETRFARDVEQVPAWARGDDAAAQPRTIADFGFQASRLLTLRTRNAAAYKGIYALFLAHGARDWKYDQALDKVQYVNLAVDIHHVFPYRWSLDNGIDPALRESVVNKTPLSAATNREIGGVAPSRYLPLIEQKARLSSQQLDTLLASHAVDAAALRADDFDAHFRSRRAAIVRMIERATGRKVQDDFDDDRPAEGVEQFDPEDVAVIADIDDVDQ